MMDLSHLEWPFFEPEHRQFAIEFEQWASHQLAEFEDDEGGDGCAARRIFELVADSGWLEGCVSADEPRATHRLIDLRRMCLMREIGAHASVMVDVGLSEPWLGILPIALHGSTDHHNRYLADYERGKLLPAFALSEPNVGSDASSITTTAKPADDHFVINGTKAWTSNSGLADVYVVFAHVEDVATRAGITAFVVDANCPGISLNERTKVMSPHTVGTWALENCRVPAANMIGDVGQGLRIALHALEVFRPTVAAAAVGLARRAMTDSIERSKARVAFKKPISEHQLVQAKLADMAVGIEAAALLAYRAAWEHDVVGTSNPRAAAVAKLFSTETASTVIDQAVQIHGGQGVVAGSRVERLYRHSRAYRIFDGTSEIQKLVIARSLLEN